MFDEILKAIKTASINVMFNGKVLYNEFYWKIYFLTRNMYFSTNVNVVISC